VSPPTPPPTRSRSAPARTRDPPRPRPRRRPAPRRRPRRRGPPALPLAPLPASVAPPARPPRGAGVELGEEFAAPHRVRRRSCGGETIVGHGTIAAPADAARPATSPPDI
jgi:hypothetical protein